VPARADGARRPVERPRSATRPYVIDWWWLAFAAVSGALIVALALARRSAALWWAGANLALVGYDAVVLANGDRYDGRGHFDLFTYGQTSSFPGGREWLGGAAVLAVAVALARSRRVLVPRPNQRATLVLSLACAAALAVIAQSTWGAFFFLRWFLLAAVIAAALLGLFDRRLPVAALGLALAALPSTVTFLTAANVDHNGWTLPWAPVALAVISLGLLAQALRRSAPADMPGLRAGSGP
jgi:hypothetical protein